MPEVDLGAISLVDAAAIMRVTATVLFALAVLHTFLVKRFQHWASRFRPGSVGENLFHFFGEVEVVFGLWAGVLIAIWAVRISSDSSVAYLESMNFTEPVFVFVIMCMAATRPVLKMAGRLIFDVSRLIPLPRATALFICTMIIGPLFGSLITEPAAMTVTALLMKEYFFSKPSMSERFRYATLGLLFVNISVGGVLTHFAAPPVLMVAGIWGWDTPFMFSQFGIRATLAVVTGTLLTATVFYRDLQNFEVFDSARNSAQREKSLPIWLVTIHLAFLFGTVWHSHHVAFFVPLFLMFLGWCKVTEEYQDELKVRESLLVGFFLGGLVVLGKLQDWWLQPVVAGLPHEWLYWGAAALTAITDNAALTYLGTLVPDLGNTSKYALVAGAVTGGGLTVIANAPNPAGFGILSPTFGEEGISPLRLFLGAFPYTLIASAAFLM